MTKLSITIHSTDNPLMELAVLLDEKAERLQQLSDKLFENGRLVFAEDGNPIATIELIPEVWHD